MRLGHSNVVSRSLCVSTMSVMITVSILVTDRATSSRTWKSAP